MARTFSKLTRPLIRKLPQGRKINEHGISFERLSDGDGVFTVNVMVDGRRIHRVIGRESEGTTRTQAEEFIQQARQDAKSGRLNLPKGRKRGLTFKEAAAKYLHQLRESGGKDLKMKTVRLELHLVPFFGDSPLARITSFEVERYKKNRRSESVIVRPRGKIIDRGSIPTSLTKPSTINRELAVLSHLFNKAHEWGWIERPALRIRRYQEGQGRITYLTVEQIQRLIECAKADSSPVVYPFVVIALETAMRKMEILGIRKENISIDHRVISIPAVTGETKTGAREQPITQHLAGFLAGYLAASQPGTPWLFPSPGARSGHAMDIRKPFRRVVEAAGLDPDEIVRHTLRHTAITHLVQAGVDLPTVKRISGHKTLAMVERYAHQNGSHIDSAMEKLQSRMNLVR
jgi:integrase